MNTILNADRVEEIFRKCLFASSNETVKEDLVIIEGIVSKAGFNSKALAEYEPKIIEMLEELPENFKKGWSFLQACDDKHGEQWTGFHQRMDELFMLGMAVKHVVCLAPRELWEALPGGMPYYQVV